MGVNEYTITVNINRVKGLPGKKLTLRLGENPYVKKDIGLKEFCEKSEEECTSYTDGVWQWTEDGMTRHLKRQEDARIPSERFCFLSLRVCFRSSHNISLANDRERQKEKYLAIRILNTRNKCEYKRSIHIYIY